MYMFEKVNPSHPDKLADRIAGALVDLAYSYEENPKIAVEVLLGHGQCHIVAETSVELNTAQVRDAVWRITGDEKMAVDLLQVPQDKHLANNQSGKIRCGDNGIFVGKPVSMGEQELTNFVAQVYGDYPYDGKYILSGKDLICCQSNVDSKIFKARYLKFLQGRRVKVNPLGDWTGGPNVDTGATNRKLGSDMGRAVTGGGLHGKDASKADVSVNIYAHIKAQNGASGKVKLFCAIGDEAVDGLPYSEIVSMALRYIRSLGGFEKFAEWGLIRPNLKK